MAILCKLINATSWWVLNKDSDVQAMATAILNQWVINDATTWNLAVTAWQVASGKCFIEVTRTNTSPNEKWLLYVWNQSNTDITIWSNKFIYIEIPQNNINDNTINTNPTWSWIANIVVWTAWPASNYIPLATTDWSWNITDVRTFIKLKTWIIDKLTGNTWKMFYTDWAWKIQEITIWSSTQVLTSNGTNSAPTFQSISIDITALTEKTTIQENDLFVMYSASNTANRKIKATNALKSTKEIFVAWENITAWNALYIHTDWKVYKTDASNASKINFIWFATNTVSTWWNVIVDTSWVSATQSGLTAWSDYYLSNTAWDISTTPWTNVVSVWKAVSTTWIEILNNDKYNRGNYVSNSCSMNITRVMGSTEEVVYNHSLWKIPKLITLNAFASVASWQNPSSYGSYDWTNNRCTWEQAINQAVFQSNTLINIQNNTTAWNSWVISNVTSTTFTITWTQLAGWSWGATIMGNITLIA